MSPEELADEQRGEAEELADLVDLAREQWESLRPDTHLAELAESLAWIARLVKRLEAAGLAGRALWTHAGMKLRCPGDQFGLGDIMVEDALGVLAAEANMAAARKGAHR